MLSRIVSPALLAALVALAPGASAQTWTGLTASGSWNTPGNWSTNTVPNSATATVLFPSQSGAFLGGANIATGVQAQSLTFNNTAGNYNITASGGQTLSSVQAITVASGVTTTQTINLSNIASGSLLFPISGLTITNSAALGATPTLVIGPSTAIGTTGSGALSVGGTGFTRISGAFAGGANAIGGLTKTGVGQLDLNLSGTASSFGTLAVNAGSVTVGSGNLNLTAANIPLNISGGSAAALTVSGGAIVTATGSATFSQIDGPGTGAVVTGVGSQLRFATEIDVGVNGNSSLTVQNGGAVTSQTAFVGYFQGSTGAATVSGAGSQFNSSSSLYLGFNGSGSLTVQNNASVVTGLTLLVGAGGPGALSIQTGGTVTSLFGNVGSSPGVNGTVTVTGAGSAWSNTDVLYLGGSSGTVGGTGLLTVGIGGAVTVGGTTNLVTSSSSITVNSGTMTTGSLAAANGVTSSVLLTDPAGGTALTVGSDNKSTTYAGTVADATGGPGTVAKTGTGTLTLTGHLTNTGGYKATGGTLEFSGAVVQPGPGSLTAAAGATLKYDAGARIFGGYLYGPGTHIVTGGATFTGVTAFNNAVIDVTGAGSFASFGNGGTLTVTAGASFPATFNGFTNQGSGSLVVGPASVVNASNFQSYGQLTLNPGSSASQPTKLVNASTSPMFFNGGSRTFIGTPATASQNLVGVDLHGQNLVIAGGLFVNNGFVADSTAAPGSVIVDFGALYKGAGTNFVSVVTQNGGRVQAGNSPGSMGFGKFVFGPGGVNNYVFAIDNATGTAGPSPDAQGLVSGWGLVKAVKEQYGATTTSGDFVWTATPGNKLTFALDTLVNPTMVGTDLSGPMANFDSAQSYSWPAVQWTGSYSGPTDVAALNAATSFDTSGFVNAAAGTFGWSLDVPDHTLSLTYSPTAVPEPGTLALASVAAIGWVTFWRRRWAPVRVALGRGRA